MISSTIEFSVSPVKNLIFSFTMERKPIGQMLPVSTVNGHAFLAVAVVWASLLAGAVIFGLIFLPKVGGELLLKPVALGHIAFMKCSHGTFFFFISIDFQAEFPPLFFQESPENTGLRRVLSRDRSAGTADYRFGLGRWWLVPENTMPRWQSRVTVVPLFNSLVAFSAPTRTGRSSARPTMAA